jgi:hypothetical protein
MSCILSITLDGREPTASEAPKLRVGQPVRGMVHVFVTKAVRCEGLDVELTIESRHLGFSPGLSHGKVRIFTGSWEPGEYDYPFAITSVWPPTYDGVCVGWRWQACARAVLGFGRSATGKAEIQLDIAPSAALAVTLPPPETERPQIRAPGFGGVVGLGATVFIALLASAIGVALKLAELAPDEVSGAVAGVGLSVSVIIGLLFGGKWLAWRKEGGNRLRAAIALKLAPGASGYRSELECSVKTRGGGIVRRVCAALVVKERAHWRTKNPHRKHMREEVIHRHEVELAGDGDLGEFGGALPLPASDAVPCFSLADAEGRGLLWQVEVLVYGDDGVPTVHTRSLEVGRAAMKR